MVCISEAYCLAMSGFVRVTSDFRMDLARKMAVLSTASIQLAIG
jgi:hypothetical protein